MADETRVVKKLILSDGSKVGIVNLEVILKEVAVLKLTVPDDIKTELLNKATLKNYIPSSAKADYAEALFLEYQRKYIGITSANKPETHKHTAG